MPWLRHPVSLSRSHLQQPSLRRLPPLWLLRPCAFRLLPQPYGFPQRAFSLLRLPAWLSVRRACGFPLPAGDVLPQPHAEGERPALARSQPVLLAFWVPKQRARSQAAVEAEAEAQLRFSPRQALRPASRACGGASPQPQPCWCGRG